MLDVTVKVIKKAPSENLKKSKEFYPSIAFGGIESEPEYVRSQYESLQNSVHN